MANVLGKFYSGVKLRKGVTPESPTELIGVQPYPLNPPGSGNFVTIDTDQTITGEKTFNNEKLTLLGPNPVFRIRSTSNNSILNFSDITGQDVGGIELLTVDGKLKIVTRTDNTDIEINPHGTGAIILPNLATGTGELLMLDGSNKVVKGSLSNSLRFQQSALGFSKDLGTLATDVGQLQTLTWVSIFNATNFEGSRSFDSDIECTSESLYRIKGRVVFTGGIATPAPEINIRFNFFGQDFYNGTLFNTGGTTTRHYTYQFEAYLKFGKDGINNKFLLQYTVDRILEGQTDFGGTFAVNYSGDISSTITGTGDLDILGGGNQNSTAKVYEITCEKLK